MEPMVLVCEFNYYLALRISAGISKSFLRLSISLTPIMVTGKRLLKLLSRYLLSIREIAIMDLWSPSTKRDGNHK